jgi:hypothetical protein
MLCMVSEFDCLSHMQVTGSGTGVRKHTLFFLGFRISGKRQQRKSWWGRHGTSHAQQASSVQPLADMLQQHEGTGTGIPQTPLDFYYGSSSGAMGTPKLPADIPIARNVSGAEALCLGSGTTAGHQQATTLPQVFRKPTSVRLMISDAGAAAQAGNADVQPEGPDVAEERRRVEGMWQEFSTSLAAGVTADGAGSGAPSAIILHELCKVYPGKDGNGDKIAVKNLSLAIQRRECFGLLGPNGAGVQGVASPPPHTHAHRLPCFQAITFSNASNPRSQGKHIAAQCMPRPSPPSGRRQDHHTSHDGGLPSAF